MKKMIILFFFITLTLSFTHTTYAAVNTDIIRPLYVTILKANSEIEITNNTASVKTSVTSKKQCKLSITMSLQRKSGTSWKTLKTWTASKENARTLTLSKEYSVNSGTYRVKATVSAGDESTIITSATKTN